MHAFHTILFVSDVLADDVDVLEQALCIANANNAELNALIVCPGLPKELAKYKHGFEASLIQRLAEALQAARATTHVDETAVPVAIQVEVGSMPAERIVRHVLKHADDLLIKRAESDAGSRGIKAVDMELLRKCPCPVWLGRPVRTGWRTMKVAVAIDPQCHEPEGRDLAQRLLQVSRALADRCDGELHIISCWDYPYENSLQNSPWISMPEHEVHQAVMNIFHRHRTALDRAIAESGIGGTLRVHHVRGSPDRMIPAFVKEEGIDILVMGTVARTGIPGFILGNTAENIVQSLSCSLLALKPHGFVSPVRAY